MTDTEFPATQFVRVSVNVPHLRGLFDYHVPPPLSGQVEVGSLVAVPFGEQKVQGIVVEGTDTPQVEDTRPVSSLIDPHPVLTPQQVQLAQWLAERQLAPLPLCLAAMLPPGLSKLADTLFQVAREPRVDESLTTLQQRLLASLAEHGPLRGRQIDRRIPRQQWRTAMRGLIQHGLVASAPILPEPTVRPKTIKTVRLAVPPAVAMEQWNDLGRGDAGLRRQQVMEFLIQEAWEVDTAWVYAHAPGANINDLRRLAAMGLIRLGENEIWRDPLDDLHYELNIPPGLTLEQQAVWDVVHTAIRDHTPRAPLPIIIQGVTGSGKTEVYLRAAQAVLAQGRSALVLTPEISLTPQTVRRFAGRFPGQVGLVHSRLSGGERYDTWRRARTGDLRIIVGARSALFTPIQQPGLIVVDEFDDQSYYQRDSLFSFNAVQAAIQYARLCGAVILLGSATPDITLRFQAEHAGWPVLRMPNRILAHRETVNAHLRQIGARQQIEGTAQTTEHGLPPVTVVDMREELKAGNPGIFSRALQRQLSAVLEQQQQAILYINRRGTATYVFCRECGYVLQCPDCEKPLVYHTGENGLRCHTCAYQRQMPKTCPQCGSRRIRQYGTGTEKVEQQVHDLFPHARIVRFDHESTRQKDAHNILLSHFANHRADILIGTQMLSKGLDLPLVTLVGVVLADVGLNLPDYRASERVFQLLTQVSGRAGRSPLGGRVLLQTFNPDHYVLRHAAGQDVDGFYQSEIDFRRQMSYPPFTRLLRLETRDTSAVQAEQRAKLLEHDLRQWLNTGGYRETRLIGPVPCFFRKIGGYYRWQIVLSGPRPSEVIRPHLPLDGWLLEVDPPTLL
jgi:primosomal protein N' (replication factor Y)